MNRCLSIYFYRFTINSCYYFSDNYQTVGMQEGRFQNRESEWKAAAGCADFLLNEKIPARN